MERGPVMAESSDSSTKLYPPLINMLPCKRRREMGGQSRMGKAKKEENIRRMCHKTNINPPTLLQKPNHILGPKTIPDSTDPLVTLLLQILNTLLHNRIHEFPRMAIIPTGPFRQPSHKIEVIGAVEG
jgi:hypothetical protein